MLDSAPSADEDIPLVVDLDGTLLRSDLLVESFFSLLASKPLAGLASVFKLAAGRAALKAHLAERAPLDIDTLPLDSAVLDHLRREKANGRRLYLASAADRRYVERLADKLAIFDGTFGSSPTLNLSGRAKADALCSEFGEKGFDYIGNGRADLEVWQRCRQPVAANAPPSLFRRLRDIRPDAISVCGASPRIGTYLQSMRVHQWVKNILILVPLAASHKINALTVANSLLAVIAFCLLASGTYLLNDLLDLANDRDHATKRHRPLASGALPLPHGMALAPALTLVSIVLGAMVSFEFVEVLALYGVTTVAYSVYFKQRMLIDVLALAGLYSIRILAGSAAIGLPPSQWLLAFSVFVFLCLAIIKRYIELVGRLQQNAGNPRGRGYRIDDLPILSGLAAASGYCSVLVLALYFNSPEVHALYSHPGRLWLVCPPMIYWVSRLLLLAHRGELHDDPVVFAVTDRVSLGVGSLMTAIVASAV
jgi:4-hydroxybenzoate polyprenyltransferase